MLAEGEGREGRTQRKQGFQAPLGLATVGVRPASIHHRTMCAWPRRVNHSRRRCRTSRLARVENTKAKCLQRLPGRHVHDQVLVSERLDRGGVAGLGLQTPDESGRGVGGLIDRIECRYELARQRRVKRLVRQSDV